jgi:N utilization substance protein B
MQVLYANETAEAQKEKKDSVKILQKGFEDTTELFVYLVYFITEVAGYAETDARLKSSKNLITESDRNTNIKITGNELVTKIFENESFKNAVAAYKPNLVLTKDVLKRIYNELLKTETYKTYITEEHREKKSEKQMLEFIFTQLMLPDEIFISHLEENFANWDDDAEMMNQLVLNFLQKPHTYNLKDMLGAEKWSFAKSLLETTIEKKEHLSSFIKPKLKNWDMERIAMLDMILMQLGVCELLYFETIPPKVTINEYIDIAKAYSTAQSGQFVNGILDSIHKDLLEQKKIHKVDFNKKASKD